MILISGFRSNKSRARKTNKVENQQLSRLIAEKDTKIESKREAPQPMFFFWCALREFPRNLSEWQARAKNLGRKNQKSSEYCRVSETWFHIVDISAIQTAIAASW